MLMSEVELSKSENPLGIVGIDFIEFTGPDAEAFHRTFRNFGCSRLKKHREKDITLFRQNEIRFLVNMQKGGFAEAFGKAHGQSACAMAIRVKNANEAYQEAVSRGARPFDPSLYGDKEHNLPAVFGVGDSLIYFIDRFGDDAASYYATDFVELDTPEIVPDKGFRFVDHLTNNLERGTMKDWADFYKGIFGFTEIQYFDIKGKKTGLTSFALKSPCKTFSIPINEASDEKSQIAEYLRDYHGPGIQHIALNSDDLLDSLDRLAGKVETLDIDENYYEEAFQRVPKITEDKTRIMAHQVLVDGDEEGYLLQIFSKNLFGPIFFEMIQRKNHHAFGEGNFGSLFKSIERDQERRGTL